MGKNYVNPPSWLDNSLQPDKLINPPKWLNDDSVINYQPLNQKNVFGLPKPNSTNITSSPILNQAINTPGYKTAQELQPKVHPITRAFSYLGDYFDEDPNAVYKNPTMTKEQSATDINSFARSFLDTASFGIYGKAEEGFLTDKRLKEIGFNNYEEYKAALDKKWLGNLIGTGFGFSSGVAGKVISKAGGLAGKVFTKAIPKIIASGALGGGAYGAIAGAIDKPTIKNIGENALSGAASGAAFNVALHGAGKLGIEGVKGFNAVKEGVKGVANEVKAAKYNAILDAFNQKFGPLPNPNNVATNYLEGPSNRLLLKEGNNYAYNRAIPLGGEQATSPTIYANGSSEIKNYYLPGPNPSQLSLNAPKEKVIIPQDIASNGSVINAGGEVPNLDVNIKRNRNGKVVFNDSENIIYKDPNTGLNVFAKTKTSGDYAIVRVKKGEILVIRDGEVVDITNSIENSKIMIEHEAKLENKYRKENFKKSHEKIGTFGEGEEQLPPDVEGRDIPNEGKVTEYKNRPITRVRNGYESEIAGVKFKSNTLESLKQQMDSYVKYGPERQGFQQDEYVQELQKRAALENPKTELKENNTPPKAQQDDYMNELKARAKKLKENAIKESQNNIERKPIGENLPPKAQQDDYMKNLRSRAGGRNTGYKYDEYGPNHIGRFNQDEGFLKGADENGEINKTTSEGNISGGEGQTEPLKQQYTQKSASKEKFSKQSDEKQNAEGQAGKQEPISNEPIGQEENRGQTRITTEEFKNQYKGFKSKLEKLKTPAQTADALRELLDIPVLVGNVKSKTNGYFSTDQKLIRINSKAKLDTFAHEIGHYMDDLYGVVSKATPEISKELESLGKTQGELQELGVEGTRMEGVADFLSKYMDGDLDKIMQEYPKTLQHFRNTVDPKYMNAFDEARLSLDRFKKASGKERLGAMVDFHRPTSITDKFYNFYNQLKSMSTKDGLDKLYSQWLDRANVLKIGMQKVMGKDWKEIVKTIDPSKNAYYTARTRGSFVGKFELSLTKGIFKTEIDANGNPINTKISDGLKDILSPVVKEMEDFISYAVSKRAIEKNAQGINSGIMTADAEETLNSFSKIQIDKYKTTMEKMQHWSDTILDQLKENGRFNSEQIEKFKELNKDYIPFYRVFSPEQVKQMKLGQGLVNQGEIIFSMRGSGRRISDPIDSIISNAYSYYDFMERNTIAKNIVDFFTTHEGGGQYIERSTEANTKFNIAALEKKLFDLGLDIPEENLKDNVDYFRPLFESNAIDKTISVYKNGEKKLYKVHDEELYNFLTSKDRESTNTILKLMTYPAKWLRAGATGLNLNFSLPNIARDTLDATLKNRGGFIPIIDNIKGVASVLKQDKNYIAWKNSGSYSSMVDGFDNGKVMNVLRYELGQKEFKPSTLKQMIGAVKNLNGVSEESTKVSMYRRNLKLDSLKGKLSSDKIAEASYLTRDVLDFSRAGTLGKEVNKINSFFNARLQGTDSTIRNIIKNPALLLAKGASYITLPSVGLWGYNHRNETSSRIYRNLPQTQRDKYWNIIMDNGNLVTIPKPELLGELFGSSSERFLDFTYEKDKKALPELLSSISQSFSPGMFPTFSTPLIENYVNKSFFTNRPIVPASLEGLEPRDQYLDSTSSFSKSIGNILNYSPAKIDNLISGYFGGLGKDISRIPDAPNDLGAGNKRITGYENDTTNSLINLVPGFKKFQKPGINMTDSINSLYYDISKRQAVASSFARNIKKQYNLTDDEYDKAIKSGKTPLGYDKTKVDQLKELNSLKDSISEAKKTITRIQDNTKYSQQDKYNMVKKITNDMIDAAENIYKGDKKAVDKLKQYKNFK